jgi:hypothetical protein
MEFCPSMRCRPCRFLAQICSAGTLDFSPAQSATSPKSAGPAPGVAWPFVSDSGMVRMSESDSKLRGKQARLALDVWMLARAAYESLSDLNDLDPRSAFEAAMEQAFSAELDAAEVLAQLGIAVQRRGEEDPSPRLGLRVTD